MSGPAGGLPDALPAVLVLAGDDEHGKERLLAQARERAGRDAAAISWSSEGAGRPEAEAARLLADLGARPLFGGRKLIVCRDGDLLVKRLGNHLVAAAALKTDNVLVVLVKSLDQRTRFAKQVKSRGGLILLQRPKDDLGDAPDRPPPARSELLAAIHREAGRCGLELEPRAALELARRAGNDLLLVAGELEKLAVHGGVATPGGGGQAAALKVTFADVDALVPRSAAYDQFQLFAEVATGRSAAALGRLRGMLRGGTLDRSGRRVTDPAAIAMTLLALLHNRLRLLGRLARFKRAGLAQEELCRELGIRNPGQLYYLQKEVALPLVAHAERAVLHLRDADQALKSSEPPALVMERLVARLAALAGGRNR